MSNTPAQPPSVQQLVEEFRHELCGIVADAYVNERRGAELSIAQRNAFRRVDEIIGRIHARMTQPPDPKRK